MAYILSIVLGAFMNRVRGGLFNKWISGLGITALTSGKVIHDAVFACWFTLLMGLSYNGIVDGVADYTLNFDVVVAIILFAAMWVGRAPGWGVYVGGIIHKEVYDEKEIEQIDELVLSKDDYPVLRNVAALSLRGFMWTLCLAGGFTLAKFIAYSHISGAGLIWLALSGLLMGPVYWLAVEFYERVLKGLRDYGWGLGEYKWGAVSWFICALVAIS